MDGCRPRCSTGSAQLALWRTASRCIHSCPLFSQRRRSASSAASSLSNLAAVFAAVPCTQVRPPPIPFDRVCAEHVHPKRHVGALSSYARINAVPGSPPAA